MTDLYCTREVAKQLGVSMKAASYLAAQIGVGELCGNSMVYTDADIAKIKKYLDMRTELRNMKKKMSV